MPQVILTACVAIAAVVAFVRLPALHPAVLVLFPWALTLGLFQVDLLSYRPLSTSTALLIGACLATFAVGSLVGDRLGEKDRQASSRGGAQIDIERAAAVICVLAACGLLLFLAQVATRFGARAALVADPHVRLAVGGGATQFTIKYIYLAFAAAALCGMAAAGAASARRRWSWAACAVASVSAEYFSTGRSNILLAALMACVGWAVTRGSLSRRHLAAAAAAIGVVALVSFFAVGALLGKTAGASDLFSYENVFATHPWLKQLALPYQYLTAPVGGLNIVADISPEFGRAHGCATLSVGCSAGRRLGLPMQPEPQLTAFTAPPSTENTFTAFYDPVIDVGPWLAPLMMAAFGLAAGRLWARTRVSWTAVGVYSVWAAVLAYSTVENTLLQSYVVGASVCIAAALFAARRWRIAGGHGYSEATDHYP